ncbi:MAG TPA: outer membrane beta-barrel protein [Vicinamibacterales bacterium]|nr:outer membrane beta-barrel protein [Vicinamibacterales bacterium]
MSRHHVRLPLLFAAFALLLLPGLASAQQSISVNVGYFSPRGEDSRVDDDVLVANRNFHTFDFGDLGNATINGEWLFRVTDYLEGGVGVGYFRRTVPSVYTGFVNETGAEIEQDFRLRMVPVTATVRFLPLGRGASFEPYVGAGLGLFAWRYTETGEFIDEFGTIFRDRFADDGTSFGPVVFGGVRVPFGDAFAIGGELRYQRATGDLDPDRFNSDKIDLGGITYQAVFQVRF